MGSEQGSERAGAGADGFIAAAIAQIHIGRICLEMIVTAYIMAASLSIELTRSSLSVSVV